jgi:hypothetical protein
MPKKTDHDSAPSSGSADAPRPANRLGQERPSHAGLDIAPGPWEVIEADDGEYAVVADKRPDGSYLLILTTKFTEEDWELEPRESDSKAEATLAAAAPDLYAVCKMAASHTYPRGHRTKLYLAARAALAKARGEEPDAV